MKNSVTSDEYSQFMYDFLGKDLKPETVTLHQHLRYMVFYNENLKHVKKIMKNYRFTNFKFERFRDEYWQVNYLIEYFENDEFLKDKYQTLYNELEPFKWFDGTSGKCSDYNPQITNVDCIRYYIFDSKNKSKAQDILEYCGVKNINFKELNIKNENYEIEGLVWIKVKDSIPPTHYMPNKDTIIGEVDDILRRSKIKTMGYTDKDGKLSFYSSHFQDDGRISETGFRKDLGMVFLSSWEANIARILQFKNIRWEYEKEGFALQTEYKKMLNDHIIDSLGYYPDFFVEGNIILEIKGFWNPKSVEKVSLFRQQIKDYKLFVIDGDMLHTLDKLYKDLIPTWEHMNVSPKPEVIPVVGITRPERVKFVHQLKVGEEVFLKRDYKNEFDPNAVKILDKQGNLIGFIAKHWASIYSEKMDLGMNYEARVKKTEPKVIHISVKRTNINEDIVHECLRR